MQTKTIFYRHNTSYSTDVAVEDNVAQQQWWYSTVLEENKIWNTGKFAKMVHPDIFGKDGGRSSHRSDLQSMIAGSRLWWRYWQSESQIIHCTLPFPLYSAYHYYFHSLLPTLINAPPSKHFQLTKKVKKENPHLGPNADHSSIRRQSYRHANQLLDDYK